MNIQLSNTEEYMDGKNNGTLGQVLIRLVKSCGPMAGVVIMKFVTDEGFAAQM